MDGAREANLEDMSNTTEVRRSNGQSGASQAIQSYQRKGYRGRQDSDHLQCIVKEPVNVNMSARLFGRLIVRCSPGLQLPKLEMWRWVCSKNRFRKYA